LSVCNGDAGFEIRDMRCWVPNARYSNLFVIPRGSMQLPVNFWYIMIDVRYLFRKSKLGIQITLWCSIIEGE
jgi:hypothetical protein